MSLPILSKGFQHRRIHSPTPLDMLVPHSNPANRPSLNFASAPSKTASTCIPLTPPLTPASTRRTDSDASARSLNIPAAAIPPQPFDSYRAFQQVPKWSPSPDPATALDNVEQSTLPSPTSPTRPRRELDVPRPTRFLFVSGVPKDAPTHTLKQAFVACGDLKGIFVRFQVEHGAIILAFHDVRHTLRAHRAINSPTRPFFPSATRLEARFVSPEELRGLIGQSPFVSATEGTLRIATTPAGQGGELDGPALQGVLASFGELRIFGTVGKSTYHAEFFDARDATSALGALDGRVILRERLHIVPYAASAADQSFVAVDAAPENEDANEEADVQNKNTVPFPSTSPVRPSRRLSVDSSALPPARAVYPSHSHASEHGQVHARRTSNIYHFDSTGKPVVLRTPPRPRSISSLASDDAGLGLIDVSTSATVPLPVPSSSSSSAVPQNQNIDANPFVVDFSLPFSHQATGPMRRHHADMPPERNRIDVARIERGDDTRTTVMIKNIPNKMSDKNLVDFINDVCPRKIDFLYLRMDFANGCNVGYAFVNFIHVQDLLHFAKLKLGTKWNLFSSEKILGMSYANYQGKEALVDKFRSSSIMDQRESWRPKLFYSSGPKQGHPEDFPAPTHVRRKERGAGAGVGLHQGHGHGAGRGGGMFNRGA